MADYGLRRQPIPGPTERLKENRRSSGSTCVRCKANPSKHPSKISPSFGVLPAQSLEEKNCLFALAILSGGEIRPGSGIPFLFRRQEYRSRTYGEKASF